MSFDLGEVSYDIHRSENAPDTSVEFGEKKLELPIKLIAQEIDTTEARLKNLSENKEKPNIEEAIKSLEKQLGIEGDAQRALEASLFIDPVFLKVSLLRGDKHPERLFGDESWKGWLEARLYLKEQETLSFEVICEAHRLLTQGLEIDGGVVRDFVVVGGDYIDLGSPIDLTETRVQALTENPYVHVECVNAEANKGYIVYPNAGSSEGTSELIKALLEDTVTWANSLPEDAGVMTTIQNAAELQRRVVSIHPFEDGNGRLSKALLSWQLEKKFKYAGILENGDEDLFFSPEAWAEEVLEGLILGGTIAKELADGNDRILPTELFFDEDFINTYHTLDELGALSPPPSSEDSLDHSVYRAYLREISPKIKDFINFSSGVCHTELGNFRVGGLIDTEFMSTWGRRHADAERLTYLKEHYTNISVYRGSTVAQVKSPEDLLIMFDYPVACNAAYKPLIENGIPVNSFDKVPVKILRDQQVRFNTLLASDFDNRHAMENDSLEEPKYTAPLNGEIIPNNSKRTVSEVESPQDAIQALNSGTRLRGLVEAHTYEKPPGVWSSPFVSTSLSVDCGIDWCKPDPEHHMSGILVKARLPKQGVLYSPQVSKLEAFDGYKSQYDIEKEALLIGGINPESLEEIMIMSNKKQTVTSLIRRNETTIDIYDFSSREKRVYSKSGVAGAFKLLETSDISESDPVISELKLLSRPKKPLFIDNFEVPEVLAA